MKKERRSWNNDDTIQLMKIIDVTENTKKSIQEDILWDGGKFIRVHGDGKYGMLIGALDGGDDYYWIIEMSDLTLRCSSCVGGYDIIEDEYIPELNMLSYMRDNCSCELEKRVKKQLKIYIDGGDILISDLHFH